MLRSLHIENIAVIKSSDIDFTEGFTVLSGETGAGKSIIIDSLNLLLGAKADRELIRTGESGCMVSGLFGELSPSTVELLADSGVAPDEEGNIFIQRSFTLDGRSSIRINGRAVNLSLLKNISHRLVSIHGQSDTGELLEPSKHLEVLDLYAGNKELLTQYLYAFWELEEFREQLDAIKNKERERARLMEILEYQIKDIDSHKLVDGEEEELLEKRIQLRNSGKISKNIDFVYRALKGSEKGSVSFLVDRSIAALSQLTSMMPSFAAASTRLNNILCEVEDIAEEMYSVLESFEGDPEQMLNNIENRLAKISRMKKKYGATVKEIIAFREQAKAEYDALYNLDSVKFELTKKERAAYQRAIALADRLHQKRVEAAKELEAKVKETLEFLDMPGVVFFTSIKEDYENEDRVLYKTGGDSVEFFISANKGAEAQSISKIASGGELARIMLALKSVLADREGVGTLVFDEIDAGVSGKTARKIGIKMQSLTENSQVFCVTHSAQIASLGDVHYLIKKREIGGSTETSVLSLDYDGRVEELSRILGGINVTVSQRQAAIDLLSGKD